jgi:hypothetical protein
MKNSSLLLQAIDIQTSNLGWATMIDVISKLSRRPQHFRAFTTEMNKYGVFDHMQFNGASSQPTPDDIVSALQMCHFGGKCVFCILKGVLRRIGCSDLSKEIEEIERRFF